MVKIDRKLLLVALIDGKPPSSPSNLESALNPIDGAIRLMLKLGKNSVTYLNVSVQNLLLYLKILKTPVATTIPVRVTIVPPLRFNAARCDCNKKIIVVPSMSQEVVEHANVGMLKRHIPIQMIQVRNHWLD